jgi:hypothetical protein
MPCQQSSAQKNEQECIGEPPLPFCTVVIEHICSWAELKKTMHARAVQMCKSLSWDVV